MISKNKNVGNNNTNVPQKADDFYENLVTKTNVNPAEGAPPPPLPVGGENLTDYFTPRKTSGGSQKNGRTQTPQAAQTLQFGQPLQHGKTMQGGKTLPAPQTIQFGAALTQEKPMFSGIPEKTRPNQPAPTIHFGAPVTHGKTMQSGKTLPAPETIQFGAPLTHGKTMLSGIPEKTRPNQHAPTIHFGAPVTHGKTMQSGKTLPAPETIQFGPPLTHGKTMLSGIPEKTRPNQHAPTIHFGAPLAHGKTQHGQTQHGQTQHGQTQHGQTQHGQTQHGQTQHGQTQHGQTQHEQTQHGQTQHGQTQHGQTQHGQTQHGKTIHLESGFQTLKFSKHQSHNTEVPCSKSASATTTNGISTSNVTTKFSSNRTKKESTKREKDKDKGKEKGNEKENGDKPQGENNNDPVEESLQLNVPCEGVVDFFVIHHKLDKRNLYGDFTSILDYTRLVFNFMSNPTKNRFNNVLCFNEGAVNLKVNNPEEGEYIHASRFVTMEGGYIMTQAPLPNTLEDFWRVVWQENVTVIVSFVDFLNLDECTEYFNLKKGKKKQFGNFSIKTFEIENLSGYNGFFLKVSCKGENGVREVSVIQWLDWPVDNLVDIEGLVNLMQIVWNLEKGGKEVKCSSPSMTLVHGTSGTRRTGTFVVLSLICKQLFLKNKCNLISTALLVRKYRHNVLRDKNMFIILLLSMIKFSVNMKLLRKDHKYIDKVEHIIKSAFNNVPPVGKKIKSRQEKSHKNK
ncbi:Protein-tyrosine phosphatase, receptor/non-receptor type domain and Protein-tyrosine/Dual specificity phosphatase domain and Protein-tyrosine phosphatase, catalytic domain-containing protein [Strongyloides ratti]|uniref:Protein-tyrosine phosphatase, receptor/non-receptor type domain and Protein-tyrosine/Dual specificity phosphatase domain and Protein-tyrosine phosphatase, catalytic domain-containing protein n=1 Tax=Strongyloides ratti TaxID=34506 RepID=A0A090LP84_STRRB|nr:Protein-tyrosine phosphatase, receptor/non-receptor type domain and Protein-tyrosine/Dual specificity phosphatase domain and Protein-tyrosine phosphatase, catalytic domain-containing protein [Strongyloides ratti]CEF69325.1 Protein-tyrosine phosphatase, receptor/non-receptor type domain and Protein-tyrosine/Dual specificity phosphatase domain and Protein-tyrosine phosphatase, catalytic domain-containing protein [Strongyloides ratti]